MPLDAGVIATRTPDCGQPEPSGSRYVGKVLLRAASQLVFGAYIGAPFF